MEAVVFAVRARAVGGGGVKALGIGVRVRMVGQGRPFRDVLNLMLVGRTGTIRAPSDVPSMDWFVEMDEGAYDLDADAACLVPLDDERLADEAKADECAA